MVLNRAAELYFGLPGRGRRVDRHPADRPVQLPTVSVVVPCYNYGHFLPDCVGSLLSQEGVQVQVTIIDDLSPDGSGEVADALADAHPEVISIRHQVNRGHIATYNEGLAAATGDYVVLLDADDVIAPGAFARATALMERNPDVGLVYGHPVSFSGDVPQPEQVPQRSWSVWQGQRWIEAQCKRGLSIVYSPEVVMRTSVQRQVGGFRPELPHAADLDCWLRIAAVSNIGRVNGPTQAYRRVHSASMMQTGYGTVLEDLHGRLDGYESFFSLDAHGLPNRDSLHELMLRVTAIEALNFACSLLQNHATDEQTSASVSEYVQFASGIYPQATELRQWQEYRWLIGHRSPAGTAERLRSRSIELRRDLAAKYTWQRWYWQGD